MLPSSLAAIWLRVVVFSTAVTMTTSLAGAVDMGNRDPSTLKYDRWLNISTRMSSFPTSAEYLVDTQFTSVSGLNLTAFEDDNLTDVDRPGSPYSGWQVALISTVCGMIVVGTIVGNCLVCTAVAIVRRLRTPSNLLIVSLAVSDLLVATLDMPFAIAYEVMGTWVLGKTVCDVWTSLDVLLCSSSILNLCAISIDRYLVITRPFQYAMKRTPARMVIMIAVVWSVSALISIPPLMGWKKAGLSREGVCEVSRDIGYQVYATIGAFYLPLTVMIIIYVHIYIVSSRIARAEALSKPSFDAGCLPSRLSVPTFGVGGGGGSSSSSNRLLRPISERSAQQHNSRISLSTTGSQTPAGRKDSTAVIRPSPEDLLHVQSAIVELDKIASEAKCSTSPLRRPSTIKLDHSAIELVVDVSSVVQFVPEVDKTERLQHDDDSSLVVNGDVSDRLFHDDGNSSNGFATTSCSFTSNGNGNVRSPSQQQQQQQQPLQMLKHESATPSCSRNRTFSFVDLLPVRRSTLPATADHQRFRPFVKSFSSSAPSRNSSGFSRSSKSSAPSRRLSRVSASNERKATKTLGVIMGAFIACWLPFFIVAVLHPLICVDGVVCPIPRWLNTLLLWLGFANSLLNPIIYARFNRDFRTPFRHILQCHIRDIDARLRSDNYTEQYGTGTATTARSNSVACSDWLIQRPRGSTTSADALVRSSVQQSTRYQQSSDPI